MGQLDLLSAKLQQYAAKGGLAGLSAPTYGSMIKAYGRARDIERVRELWGEMRRRNVRPTSITLGCMVDPTLATHSIFITLKAGASGTSTVDNGSLKAVAGFSLVLCLGPIDWD